MQPFHSILQFKVEDLTGLAAIHGAKEKATEFVLRPESTVGITPRRLYFRHGSPHVAKNMSRKWSR